MSATKTSYYKLWTLGSVKFVATLFVIATIWSCQSKLSVDVKSQPCTNGTSLVNGSCSQTQHSPTGNFQVGILSEAKQSASAQAVLSWSAATATDGASTIFEYLVCMGLTAESVSSVDKCEGSTIVQNYTSSTTSVAVSNLTPVMKYYYNVIARDPSGAKVAYSPSSFTTPLAIPLAFSIISPQRTLSWNPLPLIAWTTATYASSYSVVVSSDSHCSTVIESSTGQSGITYQVTNPLSMGQPYYVCVTASNSAGSTIATNNEFIMSNGFIGTMAITAPKTSYPVNGAFGRTAALSEDQNTLAVCAPNDGYDPNGENYVYLTGSLYVYTRQSGQWVFQQKLIATGTNARYGNDGFCSSLAISGDTIVVSAVYQSYDENGANSVGGAGAAYVFFRSNGVWTQQQRLVATGVNARNASDAFGMSIGISGETIVVGAWLHGYDAAGNNFVNWAGAAFVFTRTGGVWSLQQKLVGSGSNGRVAMDAFGSSVAISGDTIAVGAPTNDYDANGNNFVNATGAIFVFTRTTTTWSLQQRLVATGTNARLASSFAVGANAIALDGDTLVVGAKDHPYDASGNNSVGNAGAAFVFFRSAGVWSQQQRLVGLGTNGRLASDAFGKAVAISADTIAIYASGQSYDDLGNNLVSGAGATYVFKRTTGVWNLEQKLVATGVNARQTNEGFGYAAIRGDTIATGASGHNYDIDGTGPLPNGAGWLQIYSRSVSTWTHSQSLTAKVNTIAYEEFGNSVALSQDDTTLVVGAQLNGFDANNQNYVNQAGAAFVYVWQGGRWVFQQKLVGAGVNGRMPTDEFGQTVAIYGNTIVVGAPMQSYDDTGNNYVPYAGAAYVYTRSAGVWTLQQKLVGVGVNSRINYDYFGTSVAIDQDTIVVGATGDGYDESGNNYLNAAGAAFVFTRSGTTWSLQTKLVSSGTNARSSFQNTGRSVTISGDTVVLGSKNSYDENGANTIASAGSAYVFKRTNGVWTQVQKLVGFGTNGRAGGDFGISVAIDGNTIACGAYLDQYDDVGANSLSSAGAVYVYSWDGTTWAPAQKLVQSGTNSRKISNYFGRSLSISDNTIAVGAVGDSSDSLGNNLITNAGSISVFALTGTTWSLKQKIVGFGTNSRFSGSYFGHFVAISPGHLVSGSEYDNASADGLTNYYHSGRVFSLEP